MLILLLSFITLVLAQTPLSLNWTSVLLQHNQERRIFSLSDLIWDNNWALTAQDWTVGCTSDYNLTRAGEIYASKVGKTYNRYDSALSVSYATLEGTGTTFSSNFVNTSWISQKIYWDCKANTCSGDPTRTCNIYENIVNSKTSLLGCGGWYCSTSRKSFLVCFFNPPWTGSRPFSVDLCTTNCTWSSWSPYDGLYDGCSVSCGGGTKTRTRTIVTPAVSGGLPCLGDSTETLACNTEICPVDCEWENWSAWTLCSVDCGVGGVQSRNRTFIPAQGAGAACTGNDTETLICNDFICPVNCTWEEWEEWTPCSAITCGGGVRSHNRTFIPAQGTGLPCIGNDTEEEPCNTNPCPPSCVWSLWSVWSECSVSCGDGTSSRSRSQVTNGTDIVCGSTENERMDCYRNESCPQFPCNNGVRKGILRCSEGVWNNVDQVNITDANSDTLWDTGTYLISGDLVIAGGNLKLSDSDVAIKGDLVVSEGTLTIDSQSTSVDGSLSLSPSSIVHLQSDGKPVLVSDCVNFEGTLVLNITEGSLKNDTIKLMSYTCHSGSFSSIQINGISNPECYSFQENYLTSELVVIVRPNESCGVTEEDEAIPMWVYYLIGCVATVILIAAAVFAVCSWQSRERGMKKFTEGS